MILPDTIAFDQLPIAAVVLELDGTVTTINAAACSVLERTAETVVGRSAFVFVPALEAQWARLAATVVTSGQHAEELRLDKRVVQLIATAILVEGRACILGLGIDVTARSTTAEQTAAKQRLESVGLVAGGIAHDFNNLLVGVMAEASAAREDRTIPEATRDALRRIEHGAKRMAQLTRQLLAYAGRGRFVTELVDPEVLLVELKEQLERVVPSDAAVVVTREAGTIAIEADADLLRQVIVNLATNAADALATTITFASSVVQRAGAPWWQLDVSDNGTGIDPAIADKIFDPFFTTKTERHGLGLSAVHGIVRRLGGDIEVVARDRGTRFRVSLPIVPGAEARPRHTSISMPALVLAGVHVLVADDEPSVRATVRRLLERRGATVVVAADGLEAEARLRGERFGLVVLDVSMPGRGGYEVVPTVRATQPKTPVLLMSGYTEHAHTPEQEPDAFLEKPFTAKVLDAAIDLVMSAQTSTET